MSQSFRLRHDQQGHAWGSGVKGLNDFHTPDCNNTLPDYH
jgi:hypothetical protein